jgi:hypothetical protein
MAMAQLIMSALSFASGWVAWSEKSSRTHIASPYRRLAVTKSLNS